MSNPYQTPSDPHGGYGQSQQPYGAPQFQQPQTPQAGYGYPPQQPPYPQPPAPAPAPVNSHATASVIIGFVAILATCFYGCFLGLIGLGLGISGLRKANQIGLGRNAAIGGIVLNLLALLIGIGLLVLGLLAWKFQ